MAAPTINFAGFVYDDAGDAVSGATVHIYDKNSTSTARESSSITTNSSGYWSYSHATPGEFDVEVVSGASKRRFKFDDKIHISEVDAEKISIRGNEGAIAALFMYADEGDDVSDQWRVDVGTDGVLAFGNDAASQGSFVDHLTLTPNSTVANSTVAFKGGVTIAGDLTVTGDDITMATNTSTAILVADGTNFNPVVPSGVIDLANNGAFTVDNTFISSQTEITSGLAAADELLYDDGGVIKKIGLDNFVELTPALSTEDAVAVASDYMLFLDGGATGNMNKESIVDFVSGIAGTGLSASSGQLSISETGDISAVTAGVGLSGGGTTGAVTLTLDLSELNTVTPADGDFFSTLDSDGSTEQKTTTTALATLLAGTVTSTGLAAASSVLKLDIANMTASSTIADADLIVIDDGAGGTLRKMTRANFIESAALDSINIDGGAIDGAVIGANSAANVTAAALVSTTFAPSDDVTIADGKGIILDSTPADDAYTGIYGVFANATGSTITKGQVVYMTGTANQVAPARANAVGTMPAVAMAIADVANSASGNFLMYGFAHDASAFIALTIGGEAYVSDTAAGALDATAPADDGEFVQIIGVGMHGDKLFFNPQLPMVEIA